jgi:hypothetical protein
MHTENYNSELAGAVAATTNGEHLIRRIDGARAQLRHLKLDVSGTERQKIAFEAALVLIKDYRLGPDNSLFLLREWGQHNNAPFTEQELAQKLRDALDSVYLEQYHAKSVGAQDMDWVQVRLREVRLEVQKRSLSLIANQLAPKPNACSRGHKSPAGLPTPPEMTGALHMLRATLQAFDELPGGAE